MGDRLDRVEALQAGGFVPLPRRNAGQSDAGLGSPARLGSPLALQRRAHPGESGWIPARFGRLVHPRLYFRNCALLAGARNTEAAATDT